MAPGRERESSAPIRVRVNGSKHRLEVGLIVVAAAVAAVVSSGPGRGAAGSEGAVVGASSAKRIAVTFDDLPGTALMPDQRCSADALFAVSENLLAPFRRAGWPVTGFVTESRLCERLTREDLARILMLWIDAGAELGNHTFSHLDLNDVTVERFIADIELGERTLRPLLEQTGHSLRYFRYPYLHAGDTFEKRTRVREWLRANGYSHGVVTMDNQEWVYSAVYVRAKARRDRAVMDEVMAGYLEHLSQSVEYYERLSEKRFGRHIPQVLLLHVNTLNADGIDAVVDLLQARGYTFDALHAVLDDEAYKGTDNYLGEKGLSWLHRWFVDDRAERHLEPRESPRVQELFRTYGRD